jgi:hypothetical protein
MDGPRDKDCGDEFEPPYDPEGFLGIPVPSRSPGDWPVRPEDWGEPPDDYGDDADRGR